MIKTTFTAKLSQKAEKNFDEIKKALKGLYEILNIQMLEKDPMYKFGEDNIKGLYKNLLQLLFNEYGVKKLIKKLKFSEIDLDITLNEMLIEEEI